MAQLTRDAIITLIADIDSAISEIVATKVTVHTVGGRAGHSLEQDRSLKELRETRKMYEEMLVQYDDPAFIQTAVDLPDM